MHSWLLVGDICTSNDRVCKVPLQTNLKPTHRLLARWQGQVRRCLKTIHAINLFPPKWLPINCFTLTKDGLQTLNITAGGKCRHHLRLPSIVNRVDRSESKLIDIIKKRVTVQGTSANLCYIHSWLLVGDIRTSNDRVCKVPLQTNLKPTHHLLARWQGQVRRCPKTIHAINLFPPKWLPINCFTLTKDGLQTLNITAGGKCRHHLRLPSIVNRVDQKSGITIKYPVPMQGTSANLCYIHSWLLVGDICTSNDRVCKVPLQTNLKPTHHLLARWQGHVRRCLKTIHAINLFPPKWLPINCFTLTKDGLQTLNITARGKCRHHLRLPSIVNRVDRSEWNHHQKYPVPLQGTSANLCYMHSWLLVGDICTSNDRVCKVPLQTNLKPTHHLLARWQGHVRRCLKTIHAINLFPPKWLPINCFTLTKDGLQTLDITAGGKCRHHLRLPSIVNRVDRSEWNHHQKYLVPLQVTSANLCYIHSWLLVGDICTSNDRVCKVPLQTNLNLHIILWEAGRVKSEGASKQFMPSICSLRNGFLSIALP